MQSIQHVVLALAVSSVCAVSVAQDLGKGGSMASGSAGPNGAQGEAAQLEKCDRPKGTIAVSEPQNAVLASLTRYSLSSPTGVIRMIIQQSNCFQVVERGQAMQNLMQERALAASGQMQANANVGKGQLVAADFVVTPDVVFSEGNAGGITAGLGGLIGGGRGRVLAGIGGSLKFKEAQTSMLLSDVRSGIQVASATGSASKTDFSLGGFLAGYGGAGGMGGYTNTNEGKVIAASFIDNWNNIVRSIRSSQSLIAPTGGAAAQANAANSVEANAFNAGDTLIGKLAGVKVYQAPMKTAKVITTLKKGEEAIFNGDRQGDMIRVTTAEGEGWVDKVLMRRQ